MSEKSGYVPQAANGNTKKSIWKIRIPIFNECFILAPPVFQNPPGYGAFVGVPSAPPSYEEACGGYTNYPNNATVLKKLL